MEQNKDIEIKVLSEDDFKPTILRNFKRYQETHRVWFKEDNGYKVKEDHFVEEWDEDKKAQVIESLQNCLQLGGIVVGAFLHGELIGFANVEGEKFGTHNQYQELSYIHVSNEYRNCGIGKKLFQLCCEKAKQMGVEKLYIAAHPAEETQHFYRSVGCIFAKEVNEKILAKEPLDIQLEYKI